MGTPHGLAEFATYLIGIGLVVPMLARLHDIFPIAAIMLLVIVLIPFPLWVAYLRGAVSQWLEAVIVWHLIAIWSCSVVVFVAAGLIVVWQWAT